MSQHSTRVDYTELMNILSIPRPNGSKAERATALALRDWLTRQGIAHHAHAFKLDPYLNEVIGVWIIIFGTLLVLSTTLRWGWPTLIIIGVGLLGSVFYAVSNIKPWPWVRQGENILIEFEPLDAKHEIVLSAHYDSKTELLDHEGRAFFTSKLKLGIALMVILGLLGPVDPLLQTQAPTLANIIHGIGIALSLGILTLTWGVGLNFTLGRLVTPSQGAIDNGTACTILLDLANRLARDEISLPHTKVTIALFTGEEVGMQGSQAYVRSRDWSLPTIVINLELMAQDDDYVIWKYQGNTLRLIPSTSWLNEAVAAAVLDTTESPVRFVRVLLSDGFSFLSAGIPTTVLGTYHSRMEGGGLHRPTDNLDRVVMQRLPEGVEILTLILSRYDVGELPI
jgi:Peptidase family M28